MTTVFPASLGTLCLALSDGLLAYSEAVRELLALAGASVISAAVVMRFTPRAWITYRDRNGHSCKSKYQCPDRFGSARYLVGLLSSRTSYIKVYRGQSGSAVPQNNIQLTWDVATMHRSYSPKGCSS